MDEVKWIVKEVKNLGDGASMQKAMSRDTGRDSMTAKKSEQNISLA